MPRRLGLTVVAAVVVALIAPSRATAGDVPTDGVTRLTHWVSPGPCCSGILIHPAERVFFGGTADHFFISAVNDELSSEVFEFARTMGRPMEAGASYEIDNGLGPPPSTDAPVTFRGLGCNVNETGWLQIHQLQLAPEGHLQRLSAEAVVSCGGGAPSVFVMRFHATIDPVYRGIYRFAGSNRVRTAIAESEATWGGPPHTSTDGPTANTVILARADDFADALGGGPMAAMLGGPLLLTSKDALNPEVLAEIRRVLYFDGHNVPVVHVLGGPAAVSTAVTDALTAASFQVVRHAGSNRFETAVAIAQALPDNGGVVLATGRNFPDGLSAGALAAQLGAPVLLTDGAVVPPATANYLAAHPYSQKLAIGGPAAQALPGVQSIVGGDRYETSALIASTFWPGGVGAVGLASGENFPDALTGGAYIARAGGPLLLTRRGSLPPSVRSYIVDHVHDVVVLFGGTNAIADGLDPVALPVDTYGANLRRESPDF
jgi:putative cell wall-binding protein